MHIERVVIENVRRFGGGERRLDITLPPRGWIVVAGRNGAGKTTLLQSIALALTGRFGPESTDTLFRWMRVGATMGRTRVTLIPAPEDVFLDDVTPKLWTSADEAPLVIGDEWEPSHGAMRHGRESEGNRAFAGPWHPESQGWFAVGYGAERRLLGATSAPEEWSARPARESAFVSLFRPDATLAQPVRWLMDLDYRHRDEHAPAPARARAKAMLDLSLALLNEGLLPDMEVLRVDSAGLRVRQAGVELSLDRVGAGAQVIVAMVLDLVRHLSERFSALDVARRDRHTTLRHSGVVLIDEADAHLHVSWQQRLGFWMKSHFPNVQFIVTTHSPFVCQAADEGGLIRLPVPGEDGNAEVIAGREYQTIVNGGVDDTVLTRLFGLEHPHSDAAEALRARVATLEARELQGTLKAADRRSLDRLREKLPQTNSALVEATLRRLQADP